MSRMTDAAAHTAARKARSGLRNLRRLGRREFSCACGCGKQWRDYRMWNAHYLAKNGGYWAGKAGKAMGRRMGKGQDGVRKMARSGLESFGHVNRKGERTDRARSRPAPGSRAHLSFRAMRTLHKHSKDHERADKHDRKAERARARDNHGVAERREAAAAAARNQWPALRPGQERPAPARAARRHLRVGRRPTSARTRFP